MEKDQKRVFSREDVGNANRLVGKKAKSLYAQLMEVSMSSDLPLTTIIGTIELVKSYYVDVHISARKATLRKHGRR